MIIYHDEKGQIRAATSDEQPVRDTAYQMLRVQGMPDPELHFVQDGRLVPRPMIPAPPRQMRGGEIIILDLIPAGTQIEINNQYMGTTEKDEPLELDLPTGGWRIVLLPPWPWVEAEFLVGVE